MEPVVQVEFYSTDDYKICESKACNRAFSQGLKVVTQQVELLITVGDIKQVTSDP